MTVNSLTTEQSQIHSAARQPPPGRTGRRLRIVVLVGAAVIAGLVAARLLVPRLSPHLYSGTVLQQSEAAPPMDGLSFASGESVDLAAFDGDVALVFFGYTNCPDVCPMTLSTVSRALEQMDPDRRQRVHMMMVSVDPDRDGLPSLQEYVGFFNPEFRGIGGPREAIDRAATLYGVYYELDRVDADDDSYLVDHTASLMGIGPDGALRVIWATDVTAEALAADLEELLS